MGLWPPPELDLDDDDYDEYNDPEETNPNIQANVKEHFADFLNYPVENNEQYNNNNNEQDNNAPNWTTYDNGEYILNIESPKRKYEWVPLIMKDVGVFETFCYYDVIQARLAGNALLKARVYTTIHSSSIHNALIAPIGTHTNVTNPCRKLLQK